MTRPGRARLPRGVLTLHNPSGAPFSGVVACHCACGRPACGLAASGGPVRVVSDQTGRTLPHGWRWRGDDAGARRELLVRADVAPGARQTLLVLPARRSRPLGAPPPGFAVSELVLESPVWRIQLDPPTGGLASLEHRPSGAEFALRETAYRPFELLPANEADARAALGASAAHFDAFGVELAVEASAGACRCRVEYRAETGHDDLLIRAWNTGRADVPAALAVELAGCRPAAGGPAPAGPSLAARADGTPALLCSADGAWTAAGGEPRLRIGDLSAPARLRLRAGPCEPALLAAQLAGRIEARCSCTT